MKTQTLIFLFFLFFSFYAKSQSLLPEKPLNHLKEFQMRGNVKSFKITPYQVIDSFGTLRTGRKMDSWTGDDISFFNEKGYKISRDKYDINNNLKLRVIIRYNNKNQRSTRDVYDSSGKINSKDVYNYDDKGFKIAYNIYLPTGKPLKSWRYVNDNKGREIEVTYFNIKNPSSNQRFDYQYDNFGNISSIVKKDINTEENLEQWKYTYDSKKRMTSLETYRKNILSYRLSITYDENGYEKTIQKEDKEGNLVENKEYTYTLDQKGNWIERIEYINQFPKTIYKRDIVYY